MGRILFVLFWVLLRRPWIVICPTYLGIRQLKWPWKFTHWLIGVSSYVSETRTGNTTTFSFQRFQCQTHFHWEQAQLWMAVVLFSGLTTQQSVKHHILMSDFLSPGAGSSKPGGWPLGIWCPQWLPVASLIKWSSLQGTNFWVWWPVCCREAWCEFWRLYLSMKSPMVGWLM